METRTYTVYKFEELPEKAQAKALEKYYDINIDHYWYTTVTEEWKDKLKELGYDDAKIWFSGFSSQGDGACFDAKIDTMQWLKAHKLLTKFPKTAKDCEEGDGPMFSIDTIDSHYSHQNTRRVHCASGDNQETEELQELIEKDRYSLSTEIYKALESEYDYRTMESAIKETLIENDYDFTEDGEID